MIAISKRRRQYPSNRHDQEFLRLLPGIQRHARFALRSLPQQQREEGVHEAVSYAFCAFRRLVELGKHELAYAAPLARFGAARFRAGRRVGNKLRSSDVFAIVGQVQSMFGPKVWLELLSDDSLTPVPDQVAFRLDFQAWLRRLKRRDRELAKFLALHHTASEAAKYFQISRARVSQLRDRLRASWQSFQADAS